MRYRFSRPNPFASLTRENALRWIRANANPLREISRAFVRGDHWQRGRQWMGPIPQSADPNAGNMMAEIKRGFVSHNIIGEVVARHEAGVISREPSWGLTLSRAVSEDEPITEDEQSLIDEAEAALTVWWDKRKVHKLFQVATSRVLWAERSTLRAFVPSGLLMTPLDGEGKPLTNTDGKPLAGIPQGELLDVLQFVYLGAPDTSEAAVYLDEGTQRTAGVFAWRDRDADGILQSVAQQRVEITYLDTDDQTVVRELSRPSSLLAKDGLTPLQNTGGGIKIDLGGHLTIFEMKRDPLITEQVQQQQRLMNLTLSMLSRNVVAGGFLERVFLNAQRPGIMVEEDDGNGGKVKRFKPASYSVGAGSTNFMVGVEYTSEDDQGKKKKTVATPSMMRFDPVPVQTFLDTFFHTVWCVYASTHQLHVLITNDATASGISRVQAMADFILDLLKTRPEVEAAGRWLLETVLAMGGHFMGQPGRYAGLRATFDCRIDPGPASPEEMQMTLDLVKARLLSMETGLSQLGIDDVDAEMARLRKDWEEFNLSEFFGDLTAGEMAGFPLVYMLKEICKWKPERITELETARAKQKAENPTPAPSAPIPGTPATVPPTPTE